MSNSALFPTAAFDVVALATSAGGLNALDQLLSALPANFPAAIVVVQHLSRHSPTVLPQLLRRHTALKVKLAQQGDPLTPATVFIAPPNHHLLVNPEGTLQLTQTELVNFTRPAADPLFKSLAVNLGQRTIAVVLTGTGEDGAAGIKAIKSAGGMTIAQDECSAQFKGMPTAAIATGTIDLVLPLDQIAPMLIKLLNGANQAHEQS